MKRMLCILLTLLFCLPALAEEGRFDDLGHYGEYDMWPVQGDGKWGFIDHMGTLIVPCEWEGTGSVVGGRAPVQMSGKWGVIDRSGELIVSCIWDSVSVETDGSFTMRRNGYAGAMAADGTVLIPCDTYAYVGPAVDGVRSICRDDLWGLCTAAGEVIVPCQWEDVGYFHEGLAYVWDGQGYGYIDRSGEVVIPCQFSRVGDFVGGSAVVKMPTRGYFKGGSAVVDGTDGWQLIDKNGTFLCSEPWDDMEEFTSNELLYVSKDSKYGFIDRQGQISIPLIYDKAQEFSEGLALVKQGENAFWIDEQGEKVFDRPLGVRASPFCGGFAAIMNEHDLSGLMDKAGRIITPCQWENWLTYAFGGGYSIAWVTRDGQDGFLNQQGELLTGKMYPKGTIKYGVGGEYLFLQEEGTLSIWHCSGARVH